MTTAALSRPIALNLPFVRKALVFVDVVESVRLMRQHERDVIERWVRFVDEVRHEVLPEHGGQLVKSHGDGLLMAFDTVPAAAATALELQRRVVALNAGRSADAHIQLRAGVHIGEVTAVAMDLQGSAVNEAQRLCSLAEPGETLVSASARDWLVPGIDPEPEDLGERYVRHLEEPLRVYRIGVAHAKVGTGALGASLNLRPGIAVLPFECSTGDDPPGILGEALADEINAQLSPSRDLDVISGLSTRGLRGRRLSVVEVGHQLRAAYVLSGRYRGVDGDVRLHVELADARDASVLWAESVSTTVKDALDPRQGLAAHIAEAVSQTLLARELARALSQPLPALESYTLLYNGIGLMHRASARDFELARTMLEHLLDRVGRSSAVHAWLAKWHVLRAVQGLSGDPRADTACAMDRVRRALDIDPRNSLALAIGGLVHGYLRKDLQAAGQLYEDALAANPNESLALLFSATRHAYLGQAGQAAQAAEMALRLSPIDPLRYFYDSLSATAMLAGGHWERAVELGQRSARANRLHASTWRTLAYALTMLGRADEARAAVGNLRMIEPEYTVATFRQRFPGRDGPMAGPWAQALQDAGLPTG